MYNNTKIRLTSYLLYMTRLSFLSIVLICSLCGVLYAVDSRSQDLEKTRVQLKSRQLTLAELLEDIQQQTDFTFSFSAPIGQEIVGPLETGEQSLATVFGRLEEKHRLTFSPLGSLIAVKKIPLRQQEGLLRGRVTDEQDQPLAGASVRLEELNLTTVTDKNGGFSLKAAAGRYTLAVTYIAYQPQRRQDVRIQAEQTTTVTIMLQPDLAALDEVVVVGYGTQRKSDFTGSVAVIPQNRMEAVPNINVAQILQAAAPGMNVQNATAGAEPQFNITIRGRNSIKASNEPLIVVDGVPYSGNLVDLNPNDVQSIEILKDASSAAIYGSRGSNGVILVTTKTGSDGKPKLSYDGKFSFQSYTNVPPVMNGEEFYQYKTQRYKEMITLFEQQRYEAGEWTDWVDIALRDGFVQDHNLAVSGGVKGTNYYISGGFLNAKGLAINDRFKRLVGRINVTSKFSDLLEIGTRTQYSYGDRSGVSPGWSNIYSINPLTRAFDENGKLTLFPWDNDPYFGNPLSQSLFDNIDESFQLFTNNYANVKLPFIRGLQYRLNTGIGIELDNDATYRGRNTKEGMDARGSASINRAEARNITLENILSYQADINRHSIFATAVYSYETRKRESSSLGANGFPNDYLKWHALTQAERLLPASDYDKTVLISQMARVNYAFDSRYLLTLTARRDGYSGFGINNKWGIFPSMALGWNIANESFFPWKSAINNLKLRASWGKNGNQAVGAFQSISRLKGYDMVDGSETLPGYVPDVLGQESLGWETSQTANLGLDFGFLQNRISGDINLFQTNTSNLLLDRSISPVHGIGNITQNIGKTRNRGIEVDVRSTNIRARDFSWETNVNVSYVKNEIRSLYGYLDEHGNEVNDIENTWFIGQPIRVNYDFVRAGTWQLNEAAEAAKWSSQPGFLKLKDVNGDYKIDANDRQIIGQQDPKWTWGMHHSLTYKNFTLNVFLHGVHGVTKQNPLMRETGDVEVRTNTIKLDWWTPENPTNEWVANHRDANRMAGFSALYYESADFIRLKDVSLIYRLPQSLSKRIKSDQVQLFLTGRNLLTFTTWKGLDPELADQAASPLQKEFVVGITLQL